MKLIVRIGTTNGGELQWEPEIPDDLHATYIGLSIPDDTDENVKEVAILRIPFHHHGERIHTICSQLDPE